jgi:hypothetical protein
MLLRLEIEDAELRRSEDKRFCTVVAATSASALDSCWSPGASECEVILLFWERGGIRVYFNEIKVLA